MGNGRDRDGGHCGPPGDHPRLWLRSGATPGLPVVVAAGDIAACNSEGDEATARLVEGIEGAMVLTLGDNAYPDGSAKNFKECYEPAWGQFKEPLGLSPATTTMQQKGPPATSNTSGRPPEPPTRATTPTTLDPGT